VTDTALYDEECKKWPKRRRRRLLGRRYVFFHFISFFLLLTKFLDIKY
jgi:hypothetical protein